MATAGRAARTEGTGSTEWRATTGPRPEGTPPDRRLGFDRVAFYHRPPPRGESSDNSCAVLQTAERTLGKRGGREGHACYVPALSSGPFLAGTRPRFFPRPRSLRAARPSDRKAALSEAAGTVAAWQTLTGIVPTWQSPRMGPRDVPAKNNPFRARPERTALCFASTCKSSVTCCVSAPASETSRAAPWCQDAQAVPT